MSCENCANAYDEGYTAGWNAATAPAQRAALDAVEPDERRFRAWLEEAMVHECSFAPLPNSPEIEYCQICGEMRER